MNTKVKKLTPAQFAKLGTPYVMVKCKYNKDGSVSTLRTKKDTLDIIKIFDSNDYKLIPSMPLPDTFDSANGVIDRIRKNPDCGNVRLIIEFYEAIFNTMPGLEGPKK